MKGNTRNRILVASLLLFNEHGEPGTTTNRIADEVDISPGNLHYHFAKKEQIVTALLDEFRADTAPVLATPDQTSLDDFWVFLHLLLELTGTYRFLFRDLEFLTEAYPAVGRVLKHFARALSSVFELHLRHLVAGGVLAIGEHDISTVARNLAVIALFTDRFDRLTGRQDNADDAGLRAASAVLAALRPFAGKAAKTQLDRLAARYR
ncbi:MAG: TetR/AcrR family transcriptional regulator [Woeseiaceae bacterium]|jgi:AcrR family transcriptional regulator